MIPTSKRVVVDAVITSIIDGAEPIVVADGCLKVDGLTIYKMEGYGFQLKRY